MERSKKKNALQIRRSILDFTSYATSTAKARKTSSAFRLCVVMEAEKKEKPEIFLFFLLAICIEPKTPTNPDKSIRKRNEIAKYTVNCTHTRRPSLSQNSFYFAFIRFLLFWRTPPVRRSSKANYHESNGWYRQKFCTVMESLVGNMPTYVSRLKKKFTDISVKQIHAMKCLQFKIQWLHSPSRSPY